MMRNYLNAGRQQVSNRKLFPQVHQYLFREDIQKDRSERDTELNNQGVRFTSKYYQRTFNLAEDDFEIVEPSGIQGATERGGSFQ